MCRVPSADGSPHTWFTYAVGTDPASQWVHQVNESPEVTGNGQYLVWFPRGGTNWMRCSTTSTCDGASIEVAGADGTWYTSDQWAGITQLQSLVTQYNQAVQQAQLAGQQSNRMSAPQIIGGQGGSKDDWTAIIGELGGTNDAAANIARIWTAPACAASYNGC
jgi:hypothetical protein